jgi:hypothetical protein
VLFNPDRMKSDLAAIKKSQLFNQKRADQVAQIRHSKESMGLPVPVFEEKQKMVSMKVTDQLGFASFIRVAKKPSAAKVDA